MKDPGRLIHEHPSALARSLLRAGRTEEPDDTLLDNTLRATMGLTPLLSQIAASHAPAASAPPTAAAAGSVSAGLKGAGVLATTAKWVGIATVGGALSFSGARIYTNSRASHVSPATPRALTVAARERSAAALVASGQPPLPSSIEPVDNASEAASARPLVKSTVAPAASSLALLSEEARVIDEARAAVARGDSAGALRVLEVHRKKFEKPRLRPEALYLRMQALRQQGNLDAAARVADRLLTDYPHGPQSAAARALLNAHAR